MTKNGTGRAASTARQSVGTASATENSHQATIPQAGMRCSITNYRDRDCYVLAISALPGLSAAEKIALIRLAHHINFKTGRCDPAAATLAKEVGTDERRVRRTLAGLERAGLIRIDRTRGRTSNQFTLMVPSNPGQKTRVQPGPKCPANPGQYLGQPGSVGPPNCLNTVGDANASPNVGERDDASRLDDPPAGGAPDGAPANEGRKTASGQESEEDLLYGKANQPQRHGTALVVADAFAQLRAVWSVRPWPVNDNAQAMAAYAHACREVAPDVILAAASAWVAAFEAGDGVRYLPKLSDWLTGRGWERVPDKKRARAGDGHGNNFRRKEKADLCAMMVAMGEEYVR
jgi:hypothetical protein